MSLPRVPVCSLARQPEELLSAYIADLLTQTDRSIRREWSASSVFGRRKGSEPVSFDPEQDIPSLEGKVILVTGGNVGLGKQSVLEYARHGPAEIWLGARNLDKAEQAVTEIKSQVPDAPPIKVLEMDLSSLESMKRAAGRVLAETERLDILMLNAGIMGVPPGFTKDGYEVQFGTNYVGHAFLVKLLLPLLENTATLPDSDVRVVTLSSRAHHTYTPKDGILFDVLKTNGETQGTYERYGQSKLAIILWTKQLAMLHPQLTFASVNPGTVRTNIMRGATGAPWFIRMLSKLAEKMVPPVEEGVKNQLWATVAKQVRSGEYYEPVGVTGLASADAMDRHLAKELWDWTTGELEEHVI